MKQKFLMILALVFSLCLPAKADGDKVITFDKLPAAAQALLKEHFADKTPLVITADWDDFKVAYPSGESVEFDKKGNWKDIDCRLSAVPEALIPAQISSVIEQNFPGAVIVKIDRDRKGYEVKLDNGLEIELNKRFQIIDMDD